MIENVRFGLLDADSLGKFEKENEASGLAPVKLLAKAWKYHATKQADPSDVQCRPRKGSSARS